ncbi:MAG: response regulator transcription factor [Saprospiraceae bacterium]|nr:response regulator transcription factor [Saprospiraceae bacterium]
MARVLIVDDEVDTLEFLEYNLRNKGYEVRSAANGNKAFEILKSFQPDIILLDYMMPEMDGMEFLKKFRKINPANQCLVAFLTAKNTDETQIESLELGADDFIAKPIKPNVLASRMSALLRRRQEYSKLSQNDDIRFEDVVINPESFSVTVGNEVIAFPRKEFQLLYLLAEKPGRVFRREEILQAIWGDDVLVGERTVDVHIRKIREKLKDRFIKTIKGIGYKLEF